MDPQKLNLNILNLAWWSIGTNIFFVDTHIAGASRG